MKNRDQLSLSVLVPVYNERYLVVPSLNQLLSLKSDLISEMEIIVVDDSSSDGTWDVLQNLARHSPQIKLLRHKTNRGKGAAIRTALEQATKDICIIHDADMEYNPHDILKILNPFLTEGADAVFGSRYLSADYRRVLMFRHSLMNKAVTFMTNLITDLDLTDVETCYKAVKTNIMKTIPLRFNDFRFEVELTIKLAKRGMRIFEVPIRYLARSREEGKKIRLIDGLWALLAIGQLSIIEDLYNEQAHGLKILQDMKLAPRFNQWMANTLRPYIGDRVLEIGAGIGALTNHFIPREFYIASDIDPHALQYLESYSKGKPYLRIAKIDACKGEDFAQIHDQFDTVLMINVLEHVRDEQTALRNSYSVLSKGGRTVILVPQYPVLYGSFDRVLEHRERYTKEKLKASLSKAGFRVEKIFDFNKTTVPSWFINGRIFKHTRFSRVQVKILELIMPLIRRVDPILPWGGLSIIGIGVKD